MKAQKLVLYTVIAEKFVMKIIPRFNIGPNLTYLYYSFFFFFLLQKFWIVFLSLCKCLQGPAEDDCLIIRHFDNTIYFWSRMNRNQSLKDHSKIRCPQNMQQTNRRTSYTEAWFQQSYWYASLLKLLFSMCVPVNCRFASYAPKHS